MAGADKPGFPLLSGLQEGDFLSSVLDSVGFPKRPCFARAPRREGIRRVISPSHFGNKSLLAAEILPFVRSNLRQLILSVRQGNTLGPTARVKGIAAGFGTRKRSVESTRLGPMGGQHPPGDAAGTEQPGAMPPGEDQRSLGELRCSGFEASKRKAGRPAASHRRVSHTFPGKLRRAAAGPTAAERGSAPVAIWQLLSSGSEASLRFCSAANLVRVPQKPLLLFLGG